jgi:hypothetical protein
LPDIDFVSLATYLRGLRERYIKHEGRQPELDVIILSESSYAGELGRIGITAEAARG